MLKRRQDLPFAAKRISRKSVSMPGRTSLMATWVSYSSSARRARKTVPMPPRPISRISSYGPTRRFRGAAPERRRRGASHLLLEESAGGGPSLASKDSTSPAQCMVTTAGAFQKRVRCPGEVGGFGEEPLDLAPA
jgi:hypothetical protein